MYGLYVDSSLSFRHKAQTFRKSKLVKAYLAVYSCTLPFTVDM